MMSSTPRVFVGSTTFLITGLTSRIDLQTVTAVIGNFRGVRVVAADHNGLVTVIVDRPVDRSDLTAAIIRAGYGVLD
jgi:hypothetical protein